MDLVAPLSIYRTRNQTSIISSRNTFIGKLSQAKLAGLVIIFLNSTNECILWSCKLLLVCLTLQVLFRLFDLPVTSDLIQYTLINHAILLVELL